MVGTRETRAAHDQLTGLLDATVCGHTMCHNAPISFVVCGSWVDLLVCAI